MNKTMIASAIRMAVIFVGGFAVAKGFATQDIIDKASNLETITQVVGALATVWTVFSGLRARTDAALVDQAAAVAGVTKVETNDPALKAKTKAPEVTVVRSYS